MKLIRDIGIDLGTANVLCYVEGRGIVLREPSVVAVDKNAGKVLQVGAAARNMLGRTPGNIVAVRPLRDGVITDYEMTEKMLEQFLKKINKFTLVKPRVIVSVPSGITLIAASSMMRSLRAATPVDSMSKTTKGRSNFSIPPILNPTPSFLHPTPTPYTYTCTSRSFLYSARIASQSSVCPAR